MPRRLVFSSVLGQVLEALVLFIALGFLSYCEPRSQPGLLHQNGTSELSLRHCWASCHSPQWQSFKLSFPFNFLSKVVIMTAWASRESCCYPRSNINNNKMIPTRVFPWGHLASSISRLPVRLNLGTTSTPMLRSWTIRRASVKRCSLGPCRRINAAAHQSIFHPSKTGPVIYVAGSAMERNHSGNHKQSPLPPATIFSNMMLTIAIIQYLDSTSGVI